MTPKALRAAKKLSPRLGVHAMALEASSSMICVAKDAQHPPFLSFGYCHAKHASASLERHLSIVCNTPHLSSHPLSDGHCDRLQLLVNCREQHTHTQEREESRSAPGLCAHVDACFFLIPYKHYNYFELYPLSHTAPTVQCAEIRSLESSAC